MAIHPWWDEAGESVSDHASLPPQIREFVAAVNHGVAGAGLVEVKRWRGLGAVALHLDVEVERPQELAFPIRGIEPIAVLLDTEGAVQPSILALREDFPDTPHQNWTPQGTPPALCVDDRPWSEARLTSTPVDLIRRIQLWLAKAARGELHDTARPLDPIFYRSERTLIVPRRAIQSSLGEPVELAGFVHEDQSVVIARELSQLGGRIPEKGRLVVLLLRMGQQSMTRLRHAPRTLAELARETDLCGVNLVEVLRRATAEWAGLEGDDLRRLSSRLAILIAFPVAGTGGAMADDLRAFTTGDTVGDVGVAVGSLLRNTSGVGAKGGYLKALGQPQAPQLDRLGLEPMEVHLAFDREQGAASAGKPADNRAVALVGVGSLGSQIGLNLAREGAFAWSVVDGDRLMPHNLARHGLTAGAVGLPKAAALAAEIGALMGEPATSICTDVMTPSTEQRDELEKALKAADIIIDATASVGAARYLSDQESKARRVSAFFNPTGTAAVLLTETADRSITLRDLEAQYHRMIQAEPALAGHLVVDQAGLRYSGSCRALTNRIPATNAALLSACVARGIQDSTAGLGSSIRIWRLTPEGEVRVLSAPGVPVTRMMLGAWELVYDTAVLDGLSAMRRAKLPNETGGILLGVADMSRHSIHLVTGLPPPADSVGSVQGFERGIAGLVGSVNRAIEGSQHQIRYVGEWHSHPRRSSPLPSSVDLEQLAWLRRELEVEGLPALMAIAADDGRFAFVVAGNPAAEDAAVSRKGCL